ncbi:MAG: hypothetical protein IT534_10355 [Bauldia sp.]|nr:hypothetical protein [Bauldia sp.]
MALFTAAFLAAVGNEAVAQNLSNAALECSALAVNLPAGHPDQGEAERLFRIGYEAFVETFVAERARNPNGLRDAFGPVAFLNDMSVDFFAGTAFAQAGANVMQRLEQITPYRPTMPLDEWRELRSVAASNEFASRNCRLIGR